MTRKSILGRGNSLYKGPEAGESLIGKLTSLEQKELDVFQGVGKGSSHRASEVMGRGLDLFTYLFIYVYVCI